MQNETRTVFTEVTFTNLCKSGIAKHGIDYNKTDVYFTKHDIKKLVTGEMVTKNENDQVFLYLLQDLGIELIKEIIKRSPIYGEMYYEL